MAGGAVSQLPFEFWRSPFPDPCPRDGLTRSLDAASCPAELRSGRGWWLPLPVRRESRFFQCCWSTAYRGGLRRRRGWQRESEREGYKRDHYLSRERGKARLLPWQRPWWRFPRE